MDIQIPTMEWTQIGGDMNPGAYGGLIAKGDGQSLELVQIQPTREYVGDGEACEVGFPFWSKEAWFDSDDLSLEREEVQSAMQSCGLDAEALGDMAPTQRALAIAECLVSYGDGEEGPSGFAKDVVPGKVKWWGSKRARGWRYLEDEDREFRAMVREAR